MTVTAALVKELREHTGAGMMECKKALVETGGDSEAAAELLRAKGQASAQKKSARIAAEGCVQIAADTAGKTILVMEINCETDFVAKDENFLKFAAMAAETALAQQADSVDALLTAPVAGGISLEQARTELVAKIGENIAVRRFNRLQLKGEAGQYIHGSRIAAIVDVSGGDAELHKDLAMHIAAASPMCVSANEVPAAELDKERQFLTEQAGQEGKPPEIVAKMVEGRLRKYLAEITLTGQPFVKDPDITVGKLLQQRSAVVNSFVRLEVGEGIEKRKDDFVAEVQAQVRANQ